MKILQFIKKNYNRFENVTVNSDHVYILLRIIVQLTGLHHFDKCGCYGNIFRGLQFLRLQHHLCENVFSQPKDSNNAKFIHKACFTGGAVSH